MSKTGWANAIGSIGQGLLVFGANREKLNYEKERDANLLELEREQAAALAKYQDKTLAQGERRIDIERDTAESTEGLNSARVGLLGAQTTAAKAAGDAAVEEADRAEMIFNNDQRLLGMEKTTDENGDVSYVYSEQLFAETKPEREAARLAGSPVAAAVQTIKENTESMIAARNENPDDPRYMKEVKGTDGASTQVPMTDSDLWQLANQQYQASQQSSQTLQANAMIEGIDNQIKALNTERQKLIDSVLDVTDRETKLKDLDTALGQLELARATWTGMLSAGPGAATRYNSSTYPPPPPPGGSNSTFDEFKQSVEGDK